MHQKNPVYIYYLVITKAKKAPKSYAWQAAFLGGVAVVLSGVAVILNLKINIMKILLCLYISSGFDNPFAVVLVCLGVGRNPPSGFKIDSGDNVMSKFKKNIFGSAVYPPRPKKIVRVYNDRINGYMQEFTDAAERLSSYQNKVRIVFPQFFKVTEYDDGSKEKVNDYRKD